MTALRPFYELFPIMNFKLQYIFTTLIHLYIILHCNQINYCKTWIWHFFQRSLFIKKNVQNCTINADVA